MADVDAEFDDAVDSSLLAELDAMEAGQGIDWADPAVEAVLAVHDAPSGSGPRSARPTPPRGRSSQSRATRGARGTRGTARGAAHAPPSRSPAVQQGLFGQTYTPPAAVQASQGHVSMEPAARTSSSSGSFAWASVKEWDHTIFVQGNRVSKRDAEEDEDTLYERPTLAPPTATPMKHPLDCAAAQTWIYPVNKPLRTYQLNIVQKALFHNVLVALPTGLGKTFIAAVVILNMYRWFPNGKSACAY